MAANSRAESLAQIDLTVESSESSTATATTYSRRQITLTALNNTIAIGRASKVSAKGFVPAENNAWFDSAVMSRDHAEISVDIDEKKVQVRDKGSLHGTYLNEREKLEKEPRELKDGDRLTFGLPVDRGTSRFMPVSVKFGVSFNEPTKQYVPSSFASSALTETFSVGDECGSRTFQVPDDSEVSSDVDDYSSDSSIYSSHSATMIPQTTSTSPHSLPPKFVPGVEVIDLTEPEASSQSHTWTSKLNAGSFNNSSPAFIDLSSPPLSPLMFREDRDAEYGSSGAAVTKNVGGDHLDILSISEPAGRVPMQSISPLGAATSRLTEFASALGQTAQSLEAIEQTVLNSDMDSNYSSDHSLDSLDQDNTSELSDAESNVNYPENFMEGEYSSDDDDDSGSDHDMDDQSDGSSVLDEDMVNYSEDDDNESASEHQSVIGDLDIFDCDQPASPLPLSPMMGRPTLVHNHHTAPVVSDEQDDTLDHPASDTASPVIPVSSKKDEAGAKSTNPIAIEKLLNDRPGVAHSMHQGPPLPELRKTTQPNSWPASFKGDFESLCLKSGKGDFWSAREGNKAYFNKTSGQTFNKAALETQTTARPASSVYALCNAMPTNPRFDNEMHTRDLSGLDQQVFSRLPPMETSFNSTVTQPICSDSLDRLLSSSARRGNQPNAYKEQAKTKESETEKTKEPETEKPVDQNAENVASKTSDLEFQKVNVQFTIQTADEPQSLVEAEKLKANSDSVKRKRKAEDMSVETEDDLKWGSVPETAGAEVLKADGLEEAATEVRGQTVESSIQVLRPFERPTKKVRLFRLAERVGIAAIGGAMVMGTLIYTAPTFA
ncbi:hypothetical protein QC761_210650 [Podospora bellae-mahoneyi]|uniref:FHA domain-containing protein n=1 Tax=Podospora bellae-mahoneyi TaxID=2093777 RepID=A0ABR0FT13_9PEZI|nr:hypothetical protein QC761_210650 [Podospora bellae-mahoneyi]